MKFHPFAEYLPMLPGPELEELASDIKEHGLREPITLFEKKILDGRNRFLACKKAKVKPRYKDLENQDPVLFVLSMNVSRRHLTPSQKAIAVAKLLAASKPSGELPQGNLSTQKVADIAGVSFNTAKRAKRIVTEAPDKIDDIAAGKTTVREVERKLPQGNGVVVDAMGYPVPEAAMPYWNRIEEVKEKLREVSKLKVWADEIHMRMDPLYSEVIMNEVRVDLGNVYTMLRCAVPYAVCTECEGQKPDGCSLCRGRGVISQFRYSTAVPIETRTTREMAIKNLHK